MKETPRIDVEKITSLELAIFPLTNQEKVLEGRQLAGFLIVTSGKKAEQYRLMGYSRIPAACTAVTVIEGTDDKIPGDPIKTKIDGIRIRFAANGEPRMIIQDPDFKMSKNVTERLNGYPEFGLVGYTGSAIAYLAQSIERHGDRTIAKSELVDAKIL